MINIILFDPAGCHENLLPLTYTRPVAEIRIGIFTMRRRWQTLLDAEYSWETEPYLSRKFPKTDAPDAIRVAANIVADRQLADRVKTLKNGEALYQEDQLIAVRGVEQFRSEYAEAVTRVNMVYDIFLLNDKVLREDFAIITHGRKSREVSSTVTVIGDPDLLFIDPEAADVEGCIINVAKGPVYIGPGAEVMEGVAMRGPVAVCEHSTVNMGAKIYGATTIGPWSKVGGELNNVVIFCHSNKAHDGFLGNAVIGQWCNIGAGCVASNLKNDYTPIKLWNYPAHRFMKTGLQFCGLIMGDHSKAGVNTMLNTATVLGVGVNIHGSGFPRPFLASFSEGSTAGFNDVNMTKFFDTARTVMARRGVELTKIDIDILTAVREQAENYR
jgi:UDP-N-acetylglucosamine diphosphorylase/glucosamine-1-phosphate N-acetyltransferase